MAPGTSVPGATCVYQRGSTAVPVMAIFDVVHAEQTLARPLWQGASADDGSEQTVIRCPARFESSPEPVPVPARALGLDTADILREAGLN